MSSNCYSNFRTELGQELKPTLYIHLNYVAFYAAICVVNRARNYARSYAANPVTFHVADHATIYVTFVATFYDTFSAAIYAIALHKIPITSLIIFLY